MKAGEKTINLLACIAFVLVVGLGMQAWELLTERQLTVVAEKTDTADSLC